MRVHIVSDKVQMRVEAVLGMAIGQDRHEEPPRAAMITQLEGCSCRKEPAQDGDEQLPERT